MLPLLLALSTIASPSPRDYLSVGSGVSVDYSVASTNSYGSSDFAASDYLTRANFTAYLAIWSRYAEQQHDSNPKIVVTNAYLRRAYPYTYASGGVQQEASVPLSRIVHDATNFAIGANSSSYFDTIYPRPTTFAENTICLTNVAQLASFAELQPSLFDQSGVNGNFLRELASQVYFHEYLPSADTLTDAIYDENQSPTRLPRTFESLCVAAFGNSHVYAITNSSPYLILPPLHAVCQAISLQDADQCIAAYTPTFTNYLSTSYSLSATADSDTFLVNLDYYGTPTLHNPPSHASVDTVSTTFATNVSTIARALDPTLRVSSCSASASLSGSYRLSDLQVSPFTADILYQIGYTSTNPVDIVIHGNQSFCEGGAYGFLVEFSIEGYGTANAFASESVAFGDYYVPTTARASSAYSIAETTASGGDYADGIYSPYHSRMSGSGWSYGLYGMCSNTNPPALGTPIDFGYDGVTKPSTPVDHAYWRYVALSPVFHSKTTHDTAVATLLRSLMDDAHTRMRTYAVESGGDFTDVRSWLGSGSEKSWMESIDTFSADLTYGGDFVVTQRVTFVESRPRPSNLTVSSHVSLRVTGASGSIPLHGSIGADAKSAVFSKANHQPSSLRRTDH